MSDQLNSLLKEARALVELLENTQEAECNCWNQILYELLTSITEIAYKPIKYYYIQFWGCCEPIIYGPFDNYNDMLADAKTLVHSDELDFRQDRDGIFYVKLGLDRGITCGTFTDEDLEEKNATY